MRKLFESRIPTRHARYNQDPTDIGAAMGNALGSIDYTSGGGGSSLSATDIFGMANTGLNTVANVFGTIWTATQGNAPVVNNNGNPGAASSNGGNNNNNNQGTGFSTTTIVLSIILFFLILGMLFFAFKSMAK